MAREMTAQKIATAADHAEWLVGGKDLLADGTVHEGPHNVLPEFPRPEIEIKRPFDTKPKSTLLPLEIFGDGGGILVRVNRDGDVEIFGDVNEAALRFWTAVCQISGGILTHKTK